VTMDSSTRVYLVGAGGMLGDAVYQHFHARYETRASDIKPRAAWLRQVDAADFEQLSADVRDFGADLIVNLAAQTDLEYCEREPQQAWRDNALGAENCALLAQQLEVPCVYISTAGIFGGEKTEYIDYDEPTPLTVYAKSKLYGERFVERTCDQFFVFRAGWMMGGGPNLDKKFINKVYQQIKAGARELYAVTDKLGTPTYTVDFAKGIEHVVGSGLHGVYNQVCQGKGSRYDVACAFVKALGMSDEVTVHPVTSEHFAAEYFADRPASEQLINFKLGERGLDVMRSWQECLVEYAQVYKADLGD
jgi:dTDP-4-dehydrorhamnose reductase